MIDIKRIYDVMPELNGNEFKVLFYLAEGCSYALSIGNDKFVASYSQIRKYTGIKKDDTISSTLKMLEEKGYITRETHFINTKQKSTTEFTCIFAIEKEETPTPKKEILNTESSKKWRRGTPKNGEGGTPKNGEIIMKRKNKEINNINNTYNNSTYIENESEETERREVDELGILMENFRYSQSETDWLELTSTMREKYPKREKEVTDELNLLEDEELANYYQRMYDNYKRSYACC